MLVMVDRFKSYTNFIRTLFIAKTKVLFDIAHRGAVNTIVNEPFQ
jgi:hypothetical protein